MSANPNPDFEVFYSGLKRFGLELVTLSDPGVQHYVALDYSVRALRQIQKRVPRANRLLVAFEPNAVRPVQYLKRTRNKFGFTHVLSPLQIFSQNEGVLTLGPFVNYEQILEAIPTPLKNRSDAIAVLNEHKFSFVARNNYKLRVETIKSLLKLGFEVDLGGKNWDQNWLWSLLEQLKTLVSNLKEGAKIDLGNFHSGFKRPRQGLRLFGRVSDGVKFLEGHKVALVIENDCSYLSEKLLHAIQAGCLPIYVGPALQLFSIPPDVAVVCQADPAAIANTVKSLPFEQIAQIVECGQRWLRDQKVVFDWSRDRTMNVLAEAVFKFAVNHEISADKSNG